MLPPKRILFPVDFSQKCADMAPVVASMARRFHASVTLLHVLPPDATDDQRIRSQEDLSAFGWPAFARMTACQGMLQGDPAEKILQYARDNRIDLIMMPTHGYGLFRRMVLGSVTLKVLHEAVCPVFTDIHSEDRVVTGDPAIRNVLCAVDFTTHGEHVLSQAAELAKALEAKLSVAHAIPLSVAAATVDAAILDWTPQVEEAAREQIGQLQAKTGTNADVYVVPGEVSYAVQSAAESCQADLLVVGRGSHETRAGRLLDHTYPIIRHSPCPVISI
jgi:nucleotide-binding universal stress UspA family protein